MEDHWGRAGCEEGLARVLAGDFPNTIQCAYVHLVPRAECEHDYPGQITQNMVCAGDEKYGRDSCQVRPPGPASYIVQDIAGTKREKDSIQHTETHSGAGRDTMDSQPKQTVQRQGWKRRDSQEADEARGLPFLKQRPLKYGLDVVMLEWGAQLGRERAPAPLPNTFNLGVFHHHPSGLPSLCRNLLQCIEGPEEIRQEGGAERK